MKYYYEEIEENATFYPPYDFTTCELSEEYCPRCLFAANKTCMYFCPDGNEPDDFVIWLVCPVCFHAEKE